MQEAGQWTGCGRPLELTCLGTGIGSSHVYEGQCSAAYVLSAGGVPLLLIGAGGGAVRGCLEYFGALPDAVFVHNNRSHHAAELPVLLGVEASKGRQLRIVAEAGVMRRLQGHRLAELHDVMLQQGRTMDDLATFVPLTALEAAGPEECKTVELPLGCAAATLTLSVTRASASEPSYGLRIALDGRTVAAVGGDSGFSPGFYERLIAGGAAVCVVDGRQSDSAEHAGFAKLAEFAAAAPDAAASRARCTIFVGQYGPPQAAPPPQPPHLLPLAAGTVVSLPAELPVEEGAGGTAPRTAMMLAAGSPPRRRRSEARDPFAVTVTPPRIAAVPRGRPHAAAAGAAAAAPPGSISSRETSSSPSRRGRGGRGARQRCAGVEATAPWPRNLRASTPPPGASSSSSSLRQREPRFPTSNSSAHAPKKIIVYNNENRSAPPREVMAQHFRSVRQLVLEAAAKFGVAPAGALHLPSGAPVRALEDLQHGARVVVTKHGGEPFRSDDLPLLLRRHLERDASQPPPQQPVRHNELSGQVHGHHVDTASAQQQQHQQHQQQQSARSYAPAAAMRVTTGGAEQSARDCHSLTQRFSTVNSSQDRGPSFV